LTCCDPVGRGRGAARVGSWGRGRAGRRLLSWDVGVSQFQLQARVLASVTGDSEAVHGSLDFSDRRSSISPRGSPPCRVGGKT
jgi:hypothetical protein